jgi:hypothetical protein
VSGHVPQPHGLIPAARDRVLPGLNPTETTMSVCLVDGGPIGLSAANPTAAPSARCCRQQGTWDTASCPPRVWTLPRSPPRCREAARILRDEVSNRSDDGTTAGNVGAN